jgi:tRNA (cytidine/uridine-2'-O-)-methyltransferase
MLSVILHEPDMPQNTGNIIRLCANTGANLHLIEPMGFEWDDKRLRRAHLDYEEFAQVRRHPNWEACRAEFAYSTELSAKAELSGPRLFAIETGGTGSVYTTLFQPGDALLFGSESRGLPQELLSTLAPENILTLPMCVHSRSINLSNAVAITLYEAWRQVGFAGAIGGEDFAPPSGFAFFLGNPGQDRNSEKKS